MRFAPLALLAVSAVAVQAQQYKCEAQNIVEACVNGMKPRHDDCPAADHSCRCVVARDILTCFNNCPKDPARNSWDTTVQSCDVHFPATTSSSSTSTKTSTETSSSTGSSTGTSTKSSPSSTKTNGGDGGSFETNNNDEGSASAASPAFGFLAFALGAAALA